MKNIHLNLNHRRINMLLNNTSNSSTMNNNMNGDLFYLQNQHHMPPYEDQGTPSHANSHIQHQTLNQSQIQNANSNHILGPLIDWVNSFNDPYCLLVNSLNDLKDGK